MFSDCFRVARSCPGGTRLDYARRGCYDPLPHLPVGASAASTRTSPRRLAVRKSPPPMLGRPLKPREQRHLCRSSSALTGPTICLKFIDFQLHQQRQLLDGSVISITFEQPWTGN